MNLQRFAASAARKAALVLDPKAQFLPRQRGCGAATPAAVAELLFESLQRLLSGISRDAVAATLLGGIQSQVCALEDGFGRVFGIFQRADADTRRDAD